MLWLCIANYIQIELQRLFVYIGLIYAKIIIVLLYLKKEHASPLLQKQHKIKLYFG